MCVCVSRLGAQAKNKRQRRAHYTGSETGSRLPWPLGEELLCARLRWDQAHAKVRSSRRSDSTSEACRQVQEERLAERASFGVGWSQTVSVDSGTGRVNGAPGKEYLPGDGYPAKASGLCAWLFLGVSWLETWVRTVHSHVALDSLPEGSFNLGGAWVRGNSASGDSELRQDTDRGRGKGGSAPLGVSAQSGALSVGCSSPRVVCLR